MQDHHRCPRQQRRVEGEAGILGRRPHQHDSAIFDIRQEAILLRAVEAVDLVDKQQCRLAGGPALAGFLEDLAQIGNAGKHGRERRKMQARGIGQQAGDRCLAGARRPPENQAGQFLCLHHAGQRTIAFQQMVLANDIVEACRTQAICQRTG